MKDIKKLIENFEEFLEDLDISDYGDTVSDLMRNLAEIYFEEVAYNCHTFINESDVEDVENYYNELFEQNIAYEDNPCNTFIEQNEIEWEDFIQEFNKQYKDEIIKYLKSNSWSIACEANRTHTEND